MKHSTRNFGLAIAITARTVLVVALPLVLVSRDAMSQATTRTPPSTTRTPPKTSAPRPGAKPVIAPQDVAPDSTHPYRPGIDVSHYAFTLRLPKSGSGIEAHAVVTFSRKPSADTLVLDLLSLVVDSVQVGGRSRAFVRDSATVRIPLTSADGYTVSATIAYHGEPGDGLIVREVADRGWSAFGDNWPNRARYWLPTVDHPSDKATVSWTVLAPSELAVVANGLQTSRTVLANGITRTQYEIAQPIPTYLMVVAAAKIVATSLGKTACGAGENSACVPQAVWTFSEQKSYVPGPFAEAGHIVSFFSKIGGPFAYAQLNHLQSATRFGGMENATAIFYSDDAFKRRAVGVQLIAHETAHQWFGDAVTPRRWQDVWLSEGFASYWAPLYLRETNGDSAFRGRMNEIRNEILAAPVVATRPVVDTAGAMAPLTLLNVNSYQKGAFVLHMLRYEIGDSAFFQGARDYQQLYRNGTATTDNLRVVMERRAGASLELFFNQWLHRPGYAELTVRWQYDASKRIVTFNIRQGDKFAPYAMSLVVAIRDAAGREERRSIPVAAELDQSVPLALSRLDTPVLVMADPDVQLLARITVSR